MHLIKTLESNSGVPVMSPMNDMGGDWVGCTVDMSVNFGNCSQGFAVLTEEKPGKASNWYFILPNVHGTRADGTFFLGWRCDSIPELPSAGMGGCFSTTLLFPNNLTARTAPKYVPVAVKDLTITFTECSQHARRRLFRRAGPTSVLPCLLRLGMIQMEE
jgi:hypothetical protein